jgi:hypothetical protein
MISTHIRFLTIIVVLATPVVSLAGVTVGVNQKSVVHKSSNGVTIAFPDVCKTPSPGGPVPIPYPNIAKSADTSKGSKSTKRNAASYSLSGKGNAKLTIRQTAGKDSATKATYVDGKGKTLPLREPALVELANGELCGICATKDGRVTAVYRLLPRTSKRKRN